MVECKRIFFSLNSSLAVGGFSSAKETTKRISYQQLQTDKFTLHTRRVDGLLGGARSGAMGGGFSTLFM
jgi:hypothetical protein